MMSTFFLVCVLLLSWPDTHATPPAQPPSPAPLARLLRPGSWHAPTRTAALPLPRPPCRTGFEGDDDDLLVPVVQVGRMHTAAKPPGCRGRHRDARRLARAPSRNPCASRPAANCCPPKWNVLDLPACVREGRGSASTHCKRMTTLQMRLPYLRRRNAQAFNLPCQPRPLPLPRAPPPPHPQVEVPYFLRATAPRGVTPEAEPALGELEGGWGCGRVCAPVCGLLVEGKQGAPAWRRGCVAVLLTGGAGGGGGAGPTAGLQQQRGAAGLGLICREAGCTVQCY